jgi:hypothetical protein
MARLSATEEFLRRSGKRIGRTLRQGSQQAVNSARIDHGQKVLSMRNDVVEQMCRHSGFEPYGREIHKMMFVFINQNRHFERSLVTASAVMKILSPASKRNPLLWTQMIFGAPRGRRTS